MTISVLLREAWECLPLLSEQFIQTHEWIPMRWIIAREGAKVRVYCNFKSIDGESMKDALKPNSNKSVLRNRESNGDDAING